MEQYTRIVREYPHVQVRFTKGKIDIFKEKQFHDYYEIYLLLKEQVEFTSDHMRRRLSPYSVVVIPPGEYHNFKVEDDAADSYERCVLNIYPTLLGDAVLEEALLHKGTLSLTAEHRIVQHFLYLKEALAQYSHEDFQYILAAITTDIVFLIKQHAGNAGNTSQNLLHPLSSQIMEYINTHYKSHISLEDIAGHFFLSVSSVAHVFKNDFGISIKKYIIEKRINEMHRCLQKGDKPQEVADEFGFANYSTFYRSYYKHFGIPPSHTSTKQKSLP